MLIVQLFKYVFALLFEPEGYCELTAPAAYYTVSRVNWQHRCLLYYYTP